MYCLLLPDGRGQRDQAVHRLRWPWLAHRRRERPCGMWGLPGGRGVGVVITVEHLPNGYWQATIRLPWPPAADYVQTESSFHDKQEAHDWGEWMVHYLTAADPEKLCEHGCRPGEPCKVVPCPALEHLR